MKFLRLLLLSLWLPGAALAQTVGNEIGSYPNANALTGNERIPADQAAVFPCLNCTVNLTPNQIVSFLLGSGVLFPPYTTGVLYWNGSALSWSAASGTGNVSTSGTLAQYQIPVMVTGISIGGITPASTTGVPLISQGTGSYPIFGALNLGGGSSIVTGALPVTNGGNGLATAALGDIRYGSATNTLAALAGNATTTREFLAQTGTGSLSAAPLWTALGSSDLPAINLTATGNGGVIPSGTSGNCYISGGTSSAPSWATCGSGSGTVNPAAQYYFPYYSAAGSATTLSGVGCSSTGFLEGSNSAAPTCVPPTAFPNLTAYSSPATGDLLLIGSAANSYATDQITIGTLFASPLPIGATTASTGKFTTLTSTSTTSLGATTASSLTGTSSITSQGGLTSDTRLALNQNGAQSAASWTTTGYAIYGSGITLTDTTSSGTVTTEVAAALPAWVLNSTAATTFTNWDVLYLNAPTCTGNATCTNKWSLHTAGNILDAGLLEVNGGVLDAGTTFTLGTGTGACATSSTLTGGAVTGSFKCTGTAGASTQIINMPSGVAKNGWHCSASDATSGVSWANEIDSTSAAKIAGTITTTSDVVTFHCDAY